MNGQFREHWTVAVEMQQADTPAACQADRFQKIVGKRKFARGVGLPCCHEPTTRVSGNDDRRIMRMAIGPTVEQGRCRDGEMGGGKDAVPPDFRPWQRWEFAVRTSQLRMGSG